MEETVGRLSEVYPSHGVEVNWKIDNFFSLPSDAGCRIHSSRFCFLGSTWYMTMLPNGTTSDPEWIRLFLMKKGPPVPCYCRMLRWTLGIRRSDDTEYRSHSGEKRVEGERPQWTSQGRAFFLPRSEVFEQREVLAPEGRVTFFCYLRVSGVPTTVEASTQTEKPVIDNSDYFDVEPYVYPA